MFIRNDLENEIKKKFDLKKLSYIGTGKNIFNNDLLIFDTDKGSIAIEIGLFECFYIYEIKKILKCNEYSYNIISEISCLYIFKGKTYLKTDRTVVSFPGKAFDFTEELVLLTLEKC